MPVIEVAAVRGRAVVGGVPVPGGPGDADPGAWAVVGTLPDDLVADLGAWARSADTVARSGAGASSPEAVRVSRTGRRVAARVSVRLGAAVDYLDPVTGVRIPLRAVSARPLPAVLLPARRAWLGGRRTVSTVFTEPTPWATGLAVSALVAGLTLVTNLALALPMVAGLGWLGLLIDLVVVAGLVPALWLNRRVPAWRWAVWGAFAGMATAVLPLLVAAAGGGTG